MAVGAPLDGPTAAAAAAAAVAAATAPHEPAPPRLQAATCALLLRLRASPDDGVLWRLLMALALDACYFCWRRAAPASLEAGSAAFCLHLGTSGATLLATFLRAGGGSGVAGPAGRALLLLFASGVPALLVLWTHKFMRLR